MSKLAGKVAVVTGASKGIGTAIALALAAEGAAVVVNYASSRSGADAVVERIVKAGGQALAVQADVAQAEQAQALIAATVERFGRLDIVVNNSGVYEVAPLEDITPAHFHRQMDINVLGPLQVTQAASKHLGTGASVINIGSLVSVLTPPGMAVYSATKGALDAITGVLSAELGPRGIRVNSINPGMVDTEGAQAAGFVGSDFQTQLVARTPLGRIAAPDDIAAIAVFLASDDARWVTGEQIKAGGGFK